MLSAIANAPIPLPGSVSVPTIKVGQMKREGSKVSNFLSSSMLPPGPELLSARVSMTSLLLTLCSICPAPSAIVNPPIVTPQLARPLQPTRPESTIHALLAPKPPTRQAPHTLSPMRQHPLPALFTKSSLFNQGRFIPNPETNVLFDRRQSAHSSGTQNV
jgi:hypothetical protein